MRTRAAHPTTKDRGRRDVSAGELKPRAIARSAERDRHGTRERFQTERRNDDLLKIPRPVPAIAGQAVLVSYLDRMAREAMVNPDVQPIVGCVGQSRAQRQGSSRPKRRSEIGASRVQSQGGWETSCPLI